MHIGASLGLLPFYIAVSAAGDTGSGAWRAVDSTGNPSLAGSGEQGTTHPRLELLAALAVAKRSNPAQPIEIISKSQDLIGSMNEWRHGWTWVENHFRNHRKKHIENSDLLRELIDITEKHPGKVSFRLPHGPHENHLIERAHKLAHEATKNAAGSPTEQSENMGLIAMSHPHSFTIEHNAPPPPSRWPYRDMKKGDKVTFPTDVAKQARKALENSRASLRPRKFKSRTQADGTFAVWRME